MVIYRTDIKKKHIWNWHMKKIEKGHWVGFWWMFLKPTNRFKFRFLGMKQWWISSQRWRSLPLNFDLFVQLRSDWHIPDDGKVQRSSQKIAGQNHGFLPMFPLNLFLGSMCICIFLYTFYLLRGSRKRTCWLVLAVYPVNTGHQPYRP